MAAFWRARPSLSPGCRSSPSVEMPTIFKTLRRVLVLQFNQPRRFDLARTAPRRPEIDEQRLAFEARERNRPAAQVLQARNRAQACRPEKFDSAEHRPERTGTSSPCAAEASARSAACLRYSQLAHPAHANVARMNNVTPITMVLRFTGDKTSSLLLYELGQCT